MGLLAEELKPVSVPLLLLGAVEICSYGQSEDNEETR